MAMDNLPFVDDVPIETSISRGFPIATFDCRKISLGRSTISPFLQVSDDFHAPAWILLAKIGSGTVLGSTFSGTVA